MQWPGEQTYEDDGGGIGAGNLEQVPNSSSSHPLEHFHKLCTIGTVEGDASFTSHSLGKICFACSWWALQQNALQWHTARGGRHAHCEPASQSMADLHKFSAIGTLKGDPSITSHRLCTICVGCQPGGNWQQNPVAHRAARHKALTAHVLQEDWSQSSSSFYRSSCK